LETVAADLATHEGRDALAEAAGPCDHLVVAHGIVRPKPIADTTEDDWDAIMGVNGKAVYFLCQAFGPQLCEGGAIVTVSSISARNAASQEQSVYCASKAAVSSITRSFAYAYAPRGIRVNAVLPGIVDTPMQERFLEAAAAARGTTPGQLNAARLSGVPLGRTSPPRECAETIVWLLSPASGYLTGQQIAADGGLTMV
jgi:NAD(P)-dependent dehydrogenase (short-subunit alcohol dehydrogenase family)